jgi:predicted RNA-binding Zn-ribbon protein involved in translation (DUF1610 family)
MSSSIDYITCPKCGSTGAYREQDNRTCEITFGCPNCDWCGETVEKEDRVKPGSKKKSTKNRNKGLTFTCPECGGHELGSLENVLTNYRIISIPANGDLEYDTKSPLTGDSTLLGYECRNCGFELTDENGNPITDCLQVPKWIKKNQSKKKK